MRGHPVSRRVFEFWTSFSQSALANENCTRGRRERECIFAFIKYWATVPRALCRQSEKFYVCLKLPQLFSKSDRRSSLLLLGRSGGSRYDSSSSGLASSGRSWKGEGKTFGQAAKTLFFFLFKAILQVCFKWSYMRHSKISLLAQQVATGTLPVWRSRQDSRT